MSHKLGILKTVQSRHFKMTARKIFYLNSHDWTVYKLLWMPDSYVFLESFQQTRFKSFGILPHYENDSSKINRSWKICWQQKSFHFGIDMATVRLLRFQTSRFCPNLLASAYPLVPSIDPRFSFWSVAFVSCFGWKSLSAFKDSVWMGRSGKTLVLNLHLRWLAAGILTRCEKKLPRCHHIQTSLVISIWKFYGSPPCSSHFWCSLSSCPSGWCLVGWTSPTA